MIGVYYDAVINPVKASNFFLTDRNVKIEQKIGGNEFKIFERVLGDTGSSAIHARNQCLLPESIRLLLYFKKRDLYGEW